MAFVSRTFYRAATALLPLVKPGSRCCKLQSAAFCPGNVPLLSSDRFFRLSFSRGRVTYRNTVEAKALAKAAKKPPGNAVLPSGADDVRARKRKALDDVLAEVKSQHGNGIIMVLGESGTSEVEMVPSGILPLDDVLGGGLPKGRILEIFGPESSGKTTIALHAIAEAQKAGEYALLVDAEHAFDEKYAKALGVNVDELVLLQPDSGEMALQTVDMVIRSNAVSLICIDSVSALTPRSEIEADIGQQQMGTQARMMSQSLRKLSANASKAGCTVIFLNQIRYKVGVFYGSPETTSGGNALKFYASVRLDVRVAGRLKSATEDIGIRVKVKVVKSKVSRPSRVAEFDIMFGTGVSRVGCVVDVAEKLGVLQRKGAWYSYNNTNWGQGRDKVVQYLESNPEQCDMLEKLVRKQMAETRSGGPAASNGLIESDIEIDADEEGEDSDSALPPLEER